MNARRRWLLGLMTCCFFTFWLPPFLQAEIDLPHVAKNIKVVVLRASAPLQFYDPATQQASGFAVDIFKKVARKQGLQPTFVFADSWAEMIALVANPQADVAASLAISEDRQKTLAFTEVIHSSPVVLFVRSRDPVITGLTPGVKVGTSEGSVIVAFLRNTPGLLITEYQTIPDGLFALLSGREDAFAAGESLFLKEARSVRLEDRIKILGSPLFEVKRAMAVSPDNPQLLAVLNRAIPEVVASPEYRDIYIKWYGQPLPYWTVQRLLISMAFMLTAIVSALLFWRYRTVHLLHNALRKSEAMLRQAMDATSDGLLDWNLGTGKIYFNPNYYRMLGYEPGEFPAVASSWRQRLHPEDQQRALESVEACLQGKRDRFEVEFRMATKLGEWKWILGRGEVTLRDAEGRALKMIGTHVDISALKHAEGAVREALKDAEASRDRVNTILESVPDALIVADDENRLLLMNHGAEDLLGLSATAILHEPLDQILRDNPLLGVIRGEETSSTRAKLIDFEMFHPLLGEVRYFQAHYSSILTRQGVRAGVVALLRDVTRERELDRMKSEFIAVAAHELQTPLASVMGYADLLSREDEVGPFTPSQKQEFLSYIQQKGERLERIVDDLLNLSRIETGRPLLLEKQSHDINAIIRDLVLHQQQETSRHRIEVDLPEIPSLLAVDRAKIEQVIDNLLSNAVKYSPKGGLIQVRGWVESNTYLFQIEDEGIGMAPDQLARVFEKFYRADGNDTAVRGLGLGMSIAKSIVEAHGGSIEVKSQLNRGTQVNIVLPF